MLPLMRITGLCFIAIGALTSIYQSRESYTSPPPTNAPSIATNAAKALQTPPARPPQKTPATQANLRPSASDVFNSTPKVVSGSDPDRVRVAFFTVDPPREDRSKKLTLSPPSRSHVTRHRGAPRVHVRENAAPRQVRMHASANCRVTLPAYASSGAAARVRRVYELLAPEINRAARLTGLDCKLLIATIAQECGAATSRESLRLCQSNKGALGPKQVLPATALWEFGVTRTQLLNLETNVEVGARYLKRQYERTGSYAEAIVAYYAGIGGLKEWKRGGKNAEQHVYFQGILAHARVLGITSFN